MVKPVRCAVAGAADAVANSLSPEMFAAAFAATGIDGEYGRIPLGDDALETLKRLGAEGFLGVNVTMPHKRTAASVASSRSDLVARTGVANTLRYDDDGTIHAEATDGDAVVAAIGAAGVDLVDSTLTVLGAGGAATDAAYACACAGAREIRVWNRTPDRARELIGLLRSIRSDLVLEECGDLPIRLPAHIIVSAIPAAALAGIASGDVADRALVVDLAYRRDRRPTPLIEAMQVQGSPYVDGRELLARQGAAGFQHWFGIAPPIEEMLRAIA